jgi:hypothetical protein
MDKMLVRLSWVFLLIGLGLLGGAGYAASRVAAFVRGATAAEGTVVELVPSTSTDNDGHRSTTYRPVVEYQAGEGEPRTFTDGMGSSPPAFDVGERVTVLYDPARPTDARIRATFSLWGVPMIVGGIGAVFAVLGGVLLGVRAAGQRRAEALRLNGRRVQARFQAVEVNTSLSVNENHPWRIVCQWQDPATGLLHLFKSENLWFDPTPYIHAAELTVFVDPQRPRRHHVDVSFLPKLAA